MSECKIYGGPPEFAKFADREFKKLRAENERLEEQLREICEDLASDHGCLIAEAIKKAREILKELEGER